VQVYKLKILNALEIEVLVDRVKASQKMGKTSSEHVTPEAKSPEVVSQSQPEAILVRTRVGYSRF
jgi:hypothetical protein